MSDQAPEPPFSGRALLIEDNAIVALDVQEMLASIGFDPVDTAATTADALRLTKSRVYQAAIVDIMVKDGPSLPAAEALANAGVPVVIASGYSEDDATPTLANAPRITKPYDEDMLHSALLEARRKNSPRRGA